MVGIRLVAMQRRRVAPSCDYIQVLACI